ncbi:right-handed parallel beta-helix repeat-containing protein [Herbiconiux sp. KACC 21604]|uniref:right-handed parallel beta-helix repeat-containing protein n=1 Tax=unclassified Herbiconiux TaxID=2618217 RepID=UPI0014915ADC|nr:right-handed parallel beta-helix repeat-containing protein [Herbiconiux sp. SALV-R1]QJU52615.1 hypothetical protein HL652_02455 [Herbiconiux sp. SALV-R1]WPO87506.1 right-handed parallel beta-helix repeat-containing protein [Herbiconiux sp. KACC 21604]
MRAVRSVGVRGGGRGWLRAGSAASAPVRVGGWLAGARGRFGRRVPAWMRGRELGRLRLRGLRRGLRLRLLAVVLGGLVVGVLSGCANGAYWAEPGGLGGGSGGSGGSGSASSAAPSPDDDSGSATPGAGPDAGGATGASVDCDPAGATLVSTADELTRALRDAVAGDRIVLADGRYDGTFTATARGTGSAPITLCGSADAVLDGGSTDSGYTLHLDGASRWIVAGLTVTGGQKGVMLDASSHNELRSLTVSGVGDEGVHFRSGSSDNLLADSVIERTGLREPRFGEGVYIGSARSNWCDLTDCDPDASDRNRVTRTTISGTTAEPIDVKEGTTGGELTGNVLDGSALTEADSLIDVKGSDWVVSGNRGTASPGDGAQVHVIDGLGGAGNVFTANRFAIGTDGVAVRLVGDARTAATPSGTRNEVGCDNVASLAGIDAPHALSNVACTPR